MFGTPEVPWPGANPIGTEMRRCISTAPRLDVISTMVREKSTLWLSPSVSVWVGKGARIRHAIIEEGVHIPAGFQIGFDLENDRKHYLVTGAGIVVVSQTPKHTRPIVVCVPQRLGHKPAMPSRAA